eukprot:6389383-Prymnesium_polylepis.1
MESMLLAPPPPPPIDAVAWVPPQARATPLARAPARVIRATEVGPLGTHSAHRDVVAHTAAAATARRRRCALRPTFAALWPIRLDLHTHVRRLLLMDAALGLGAVPAEWRATHAARLGHLKSA